MTGSLCAQALPNPSPKISLPAFLARAGFGVAPAVEPIPGYIGSDACRECHKDEHGSWHQSYHRTMTQRMTPEAVLGRFDGAEVRSGGYRYRLTKEGDTYFSEGPDPDQLMYWVQGKKQAPPANLPRVKLPVVMATGSHHYQTYWVPSPAHPGILQTLPVVFLRETGQWAPREAAFLHGPDDSERFVTQWNHHCILCHSTGGNPGLEEKTGALRTQVAELGISCESCHGPAKEHVNLRRSLAAGAKVERDPIVNPSRLDSKRSSEVCGQCHGVFLHKDEFGFEFAKKGNLFRPGEELERTRYYPRHPRPGAPAAAWADLRRNPSFFRNRWWTDGQMLAGGREFTAMRESACYEKGQMSCISCHSMHSSDPDDQLRRDRPGSTACVECHREPKYNTELASHTHHALDSTGSDCRNCHMPHTSYALFKAIRNHQISTPRVAPVGVGGPPNACNLCHIDRPLAWTQDWLAKWYDRAPVSLPDGGTNISAVADWILRGHAAQRVIAAWHLGWDPALKVGGGQWLKPVLASALDDAYGPVRFVAARSLRSQEGLGNWKFDFLASEPERQRERDRFWETPGILPGSGPGLPERLQRSDGTPDVLRIRRLLEIQDRRSVTVSE
jgi:predicted CXXCH cytochrome family protein